MTHPLAPLFDRLDALGAAPVLLAVAALLLALIALAARHERRATERELLDIHRRWTARTRHGRKNNDQNGRVSGDIARERLGRDRR